MSADELLRQGEACKAAGDLAGAEAAFRQADELQDADGTMLLGYVFRDLGEFSKAADAFRRAESRGHREAGASLGDLLSDAGDTAGARAAYQRSIAAGSITASLNYGLMLAQEGSVDEALPHLRTAEQAGDPAASWAIGKIHEDKGDLEGAITAYGRGAEGGVPPAAFGLGRALEKRGDVEGARAAFERARDLGHDGAAQVLETLEVRAGARASAEVGAKWARHYADACIAVMAAAEACQEPARMATGARSMAEKRPQHEISIRHFLDAAEEHDRAFAPLYRAFADARNSAREVAVQFLAAMPGPDDAEMILALALEQDALNTVATVKSVLGATYSATPEGFFQGIQETNQLIQASGPDDGNIYRQAAAVQSDERICPWCAETIKAAARICRFCGRDVQEQANISR